MNNRRILIADDDPNLLDYFCNIFERDNSLDFFSVEAPQDSFQVHTFSDGAPLVEFVQSEYAEGRRIPICLLDMRMPTMDGLTAAEAVRAIDPDIFVVIVTAYADTSADEIRRRLKEDIYYVKKPFYEDEIYSLVASLFTNWSTRMALRESEKRYRELVEQLSEGIIGSDSASKVTFVNRKMCEMLGYAEEEMLGRPLQTFVPEHSHTVLNEKLTLRRSGSGFQYDLDLQTKDGKDFSVLVSVAPKFSKSGDYIGSMSVVADITARIEMEKELVEARKAAEHANRAKSQFLANMSHEIRTPLNGILGMTEILLATELTKSQRRMAANIMTSGKSLLSIINDILDISKIEAGKLELESIDFSLKELLAEVKSLFEHQAEQKGLGLLFTLENTVPDSLRGDPGRLRQILINVIGNAIKFTEKGKVEVHVKQRRLPHGDHELSVEVSDTGVGIPLEAQDQIFGAFSQADGSTTRKFGGTGLGLAICRQLCKLMQGNIHFISKPGIGATFHFTVMLREGDSDKARTPERPRLPPSSVTPAGAAELAPQPPVLMGEFPARCLARILVAEDTLVNREILKHFLNNLPESREARIDLVQNGREALEACSKTEYDLIIMDCQMPEMDGYEATRRIREMEGKAALSLEAQEPAQGSRLNRRSRAPIIALTANAMEGDKQKCLDAGMDDYLAKPFSLKDIKSVLERWLPPKSSG